MRQCEAIQGIDDPLGASVVEREAHSARGRAGDVRRAKGRDAVRTFGLVRKSSLPEHRHT